MKVLVATKETQGQRKNDFSWADEGELVNFGSECDREAIDGGCGCKRAMSGLTSLKSTTTVKVVDLLGITQEALESKIKEHLLKDWGFERSVAVEVAHEGAAELARIAGSFRVGDVLEKRGSRLRVRKG